ncbi:MAG: response regulator transcription factor [Chitinophagales bacterium]|nr:response regulator transcription factor [Chitinophagales bacterium]HAE14680.1 DNA-binding response regulator [Bacteroidota bacterium]MCB9019391.1 response regulator transcription factor [Chitinophagales bacterium]MCB9022284.1 response regulator transcription factor [Chitinophagales bacterium]HPE98659.1 response regulator transcription factor [Chitinophagales bacterium]
MEAHKPNTTGIAILYVEDDPSLAMVTADALSRKGYSVTHCSNGVKAIEAFLKGDFQICIMDVLLPDIDGYSLAKVVRSTNESIPIIFLSGRNDDKNRLDGYRAGGDDYITKPYSIEELMYKIEVYCKRSGVQTLTIANGEAVNRIGQYLFVPENFSLLHNGNEVRMTSKETALMSFLIRNKNRLLKRSEILVAVWGSSDDRSSRSLDVFVSRLRKYLKEDENVRLESHKGVGYKLSELA